MNDNAIASLREALLHSPDNTPLRLLLADTLLALNRLDEAESEYAVLLKISNETNVPVEFFRTNRRTKRKKSKTKRNKFFMRTVSRI